MSYKVFCDACKEETSNYSTVEIGSSGQMAFEREKFELCKECARKFEKLKKDFMGKGKKAL